MEEPNMNNNMYEYNTTATTYEYNVAEKEKFNLLGVEMSLEEFDFLMCEQAKGKELKVVNGRVIAEYHVETYEEKQESLRSERIELLNAFDKWEKAVLRGREVEDYIIMSWYGDLKDLKESAFENIPARIQYYL